MVLPQKAELERTKADNLCCERRQLYVLASGEIWVQFIYTEHPQSSPGVFASNRVGFLNSLLSSICIQLVINSVVFQTQINVDAFGGQIEQKISLSPARRVR